VGGTVWARVLATGLIVAVAGVVSNAVLGLAVLAVLVQVIGWAVVALVVAATRRWNPPRRLPWHCLTAGAALFLLGGLVRFVHADMAGVEDPFPSPADVLFIAGYLTIIAGAILLVRFRTVEAERDHLVDAAIVAVGVGVLVWAALMAPYVRDGAIPSFERGLVVGYSCLTLIVLTVTARLAAGPGTRNPSYYFLAGSVSLVFVSDLLAILETTGADTGGLVLALTPFSYLLFGAAALHPSMAHLTDPPPEPDVALTWKRQALLAAAMVVAPGVLVWQLARDEPIDLPVVVTGSVVLSLLVLVRLSGLVRAKERTASRERVLREAGAALVIATSREEILDGTLSTVLALTGGHPGTRATVMLGDETELEVAASSGPRAPDPTGTVLRVAALPDELREALVERRVARLAGGVVALAGGTTVPETALVVVPLVSKNELRGAIAVTTATPLDREARRALEALASEVALALESAALTEDLLRRRSEARFRALIENSSDLVVVLGTDGVVTFVSPASQHVLGRPERHFVGYDPLQFVHPDDRVAVAEVLETIGPSSAPVDSAQIRLQHADGIYRWFEVLARDLRGDPEIEGIVVNAREITDRKGAEQLLARSEARFRALVQNSTDVVAVIDDNAFFTYVSPAVLGVLGYKPDELVGTSAGALLAPEDVTAALRAHGKALEGPFEQGSVEMLVRNRDGSFHMLDITITDLRGEPAVEGIVLNARDVTVRKALEQDLRKQALHDALTGLGNRAMFADRVAYALTRGDDQHVVAVLFVDLDDFKTVNDSLGHEVGDTLLVLVADRLRTCLREVDTAARLGGDEFAVLLESAFNEGEVHGVADRILGSMRAPFTIDGRELAITASVGIAVSADRAASSEVLLRNADMAMYLAKERGKDRAEVFEEAMHVTVSERLELRTDLAHGIENGELVLHYQPIVALQSGQILGVEGLVRWDHAERGLMAPGTFIPLAEDTGLIVPLGQWVLNEACEQLRAWRREFSPCPIRTVSVNLSARQLQDEGVVDDVAGTLHACGLAPGDLVLEITESMLMADTDATRRNLSGLRELGVSLAVDDFGTGYSSLGSIKNLPVDTIKIDRTFIDGLGQEVGDEGVVRAILGLAQGMGVRTVAEGIEGAAQLEALRDLGCDLGQGFYFSKPLPAEALDELLRAGLEGHAFGWDPAPVA
jgi:diguanylate cyclase (GGDEF)-like protein/PAS domain S-box-containing protein